jgi:hypothetical protein
VGHRLWSDTTRTPKLQKNKLLDQVLTLPPQPLPAAQSTKPGSFASTASQAWHATASLPLSKEIF